MSKKLFCRFEVGESANGMSLYEVLKMKHKIYGDAEYRIFLNPEGELLLIKTEECADAEVNRFMKSKLRRERIIDKYDNRFTYLLGATSGVFYLDEYHYHDSRVDKLFVKSEWLLTMVLVDSKTDIVKGIRQIVLTDKVREEIKEDITQVLIKTSNEEEVCTLLNNRLEDMLSCFPDGVSITKDTISLRSEEIDSVEYQITSSWKNLGSVASKLLEHLYYRKETQNE